MKIPHIEKATIIKIEGGYVDFVCEHHEFYSLPREVIQGKISVGQECLVFGFECEELGNIVYAKEINLN